MESVNYGKGVNMTTGITGCLIWALGQQCSSKYPILRVPTHQHHSKIPYHN